MADAILQMYGNTPGVGTTNALAIVDVPQSGRLRKVRFLPILRGITTLGSATDFACLMEVSTLPTARFFNNGDFGNVIARASFTVENMFTTSGGGSSTIASEEVTGLDFRLTIGLRLFLHVNLTIVPTAQDDFIVDLYLDA